MRWTKIDRRVFPLQKEAEEWVKEKKKQHKDVVGARIETNFIPELNQWEGLIYIRVET